MLEHNRKMSEYLADNGLPNVVAKYIESGSMRGCWRLYGKTNVKRPQRMEDKYQPWSVEFADKLNALGFREYINGKPLDRMSGNGGMFAVFVCSTQFHTPIEPKGWRFEK